MSDSTAEALGKACPQTRSAGSGDQTAGVMPSYVAPAASAAEVCATLKTAEQRRLSVVARGSGTKQHWGGPLRSCDVVVDLSGMDRIVDHAAGDMVVDVQAGVKMQDLAEVLAREGQQLAIDVPSYDSQTSPDGGTVAGALSVAYAGPRRLRYGAARDLLLGLTLARADGVPAMSGGRVVKNVAGYDLGKLFAGSFGTLGVALSATLRLHPLPARVCWAVGQTADPASAHALAAATLQARLEPSAIEMDAPAAQAAVTVAAMFEGPGDAVARRAAAAAALFDGDVVDVAPTWCGRRPAGPDDVLVAVSAPAGFAAADAVHSAAATVGVSAGARGSAGLGVFHTSLAQQTSPQQVADFLTALRGALVRVGAGATVVHAPPATQAVVDVWGPGDPVAASLTRRVKEQFDPGGILAPGRLPGGN